MRSIVVEFAGALAVPVGIASNWWLFWGGRRSLPQYTQHCVTKT